MKFQWTRNMAGQSLTDDEMRVIKYPLCELTVHVTTKTVQACALLGMVAIGPAIRLIKGPRTLGAVADTAIKAGKIGALIGLPLGPAMTYGKVSGGKADDDGIYDRCYRLRYNRNQVRTDRLSYLGAIGGAAGAFAMGSPISSGAVVGLVGGTLLSAVYNSTIGERHA
jgi:hypothetical protein